ncbi:MAG: AraC family transcriptional regulator, partial [Duncaniella sp.]|nr:AraC family transcriptional regulator [Duncaniella sp.]
MENRMVNLDSIDAYNRLYGFTTRHPLVTVVDLKEASQLVNHIRINYGIYALFLKNGVNCTIKYGRKTYDYQEGTIVSFSPGQVIDVEMLEGETSADVIGLLFHPDLIYGTPLGEKIASFNFFDYSQMEALHLSESERKIYLDCLQKIDMELEHPVDSHSASVLSANIQLLLEYLHRFYDRQFITRHKVNSEIVAQFERRLKEYYDAGSTNDSIPT